MDANGQRFWMLADQQHWLRQGDPLATYYDPERRALRLPSRPSRPQWLVNQAEAKTRLESVPQTLDRFGTRARWDFSTRKIWATGALPGAVDIFTAPAGEDPTDVVIGFDGILYVALAGRILLLDRRERWAPFTLKSESFKAWRLAANPSGGVWVLDRDPNNPQVARVQGQPLPADWPAAIAAEVFRPCQENHDPPRLTVAAKMPKGETPVALACSPAGRVAVSSWLQDGTARLRCLEADGSLGSTYTLEGVAYPYSLAWLSAERVGVLLAGVTEAPVFECTEETDKLAPVGDLYPLRNHDGGPFVHALELPPHYPVPAGTMPLYRLSLPSYARRGIVANGIPIDSGSAQTVWHRLYLEAVLPSHCGVVLRLAATADNNAPGENETDRWHEHRFGHVQPAADAANVPRGAWVSSASELPFHPGLLSCPPEKDRAGLFTVLIQRAGRRVRTLRGRFLWVRMELQGDGRATPEVAALRAYASRFSYLNRYLPELYRETVFDQGSADDKGPATPADFLERFLGNLEGILTPLEDKVASAYLLTDPASTPDQALDWLGSWMGLTFDPVYPSERRRELLKRTAESYHWHGTVRGLKVALEVVTGGKFEEGRWKGGAVSSGHIVVVEDFRLRRTFATILGANLEDEHDPLLQGLAVTGNSQVGDTLILADDNRKEFLALFAPGVATGATEQAAVAALFDDLAHRVTVLVHQEVDPQDLGLIRRVVELETPAHVEAKVVTATQRFMVGIASLVGTDTFLGEPSGPKPVQVGRTQLGRGDVVQHWPSLDPRLQGLDVGSQGEEAPVAEVRGPPVVAYSDPFRLDASASHAPRGRDIARYIWKVLG